MGYYNEFYKSIEDKLIYIDSNVFMDRKFEKILKDFEKYKLNIIVPKEQYDELYNLKQSDDGEKSKRARDAFKSLESLLDLNILKIEDINKGSIKQNAYADAIFIEKITENIKNNKSIIFFTNDADLRIRIKSINQNSDLVMLYGYKDLIALYEKQQQNIREEEYAKNLEWEEYVKKRKANRFTPEKVKDNAIKVAKGAGIFVVGLAAAFLE